MRFYPESIVSKYEAQSDVWDIVREVLNDEDGVAWHGYSRYRKGLTDEYASDIVVLSRRYGALIIEGVGCKIENVYAINNTAWRMTDWYQEQITPVSQVENQKFAVQHLLRQNPLYAGKLCYRLMVALPFITEDEWAKSGFAGEPGVRYVALAEKLTVTGFLAWLDLCQSEQLQPQLTDAEWAALCAVLEETWQEANRPVGETSIPPAQPDLSGQEQLVFLTYEGEPLADDVLRTHIGLPYLDSWPGEAPIPDYWYLVPTAGLEWHRRNLAPSIQVQGHLRRHPDNRHEFGVKLVFRKALAHFMSLRPQPVTIATRVSELVHMRRAMLGLPLEPSRREQLRRDRYSWIEAFRIIEEQGIDLTRNLLEEEQHFVHPEVAELMGQMQTSFRQQLAAIDEQTFEAAVRKFLESEDFQPPRLVIMEGFTRLTELQLLFVRKCLDNPACTLWFILPYRATQAEGFEAVAETYRAFLALPHRDIKESLPSLLQPTDLKALQHSLFNEVVRQGERVPESVVVEAYPTRQQEASACIQHLKRHLDVHPEYRVAVVTRDPLKYRMLLREEAALLGSEFAGRFDIPAVNLLLTPVGRFVLALYESWNAGQLVLPAERFRLMLSSGWLGKRAKNSLPLFQALERAFFARCENQYSWQQALNALEQAYKKSKEVEGRTLAAWCTADDVALWRKVLDVVVRLARELFEGPNGKLENQITRLQSTLRTLDLQDVQRDEQEIIQRIMEVLQSFVDSSDLELSGEEVGEVLGSLIRQRDSIEDHRLITVTGPESLDGLQKEIVYYLGVDEHRVPRAPGDEWPLAETNVEQRLVQERYSFLAVIRAATHHLHLTYAEIDDRQACAPSLYLDEVVRTLGRDQVPPARRKADGEESRAETVIEPVGPVQRVGYTIDELSQFQVCPRRYYLQRLTHTARYYRDPWQTQFLMQGALLMHTLAIFQATYSSGVPVEELRGFFLDTQGVFDRALSQVKEIYTGYAEEDWFFIEQQTRRRLTGTVTWLQQNWSGLNILVEMRQDASDSLQSGNGRKINMKAAVRFVIHGISGKSRKRYVYMEDLLAEEWLLATKDNGITNSRYSAIQWWSERTRYLVKKTMNTNNVSIDSSTPIQGNQELALIETIITQIEEGVYEARPGDQCHYCPVKSLCLGRQTGGQL